MKDITKPNEIGVIDCETLNDIEYRGDIRELQELNLVAVGASTVDIQGNLLYWDSINEFPHHSNNNLDMVVNAVKFLIINGVSLRA